MNLFTLIEWSTSKSIDRLTDNPWVTPYDRLVDYLAVLLTSFSFSSEKWMILNMQTIQWKQT